MLTATRVPVPTAVILNRQSVHIRRDVQGLRAVAVVLVVLDHLIGVPAGGFVGVDVFFVVSGFVITGLLLREADRDGRISLRAFYLRRVKRIAPAAVVVLVATVVVGGLLLSIPRAEQVRGDATWAALFAANWRSISLGTDYLHATDAVSPLQHFWSLSVEEQYYAVWPLIVVVVLALARRRLRLVLGIMAGAIVLVSLALCFVETATKPTWAYFSTESRAWELGVGSLLACTAPLWQRLPRRAQTPVARAGLLAIVIAVLALDGDSPFPAPGALIPVLGTAAILVAGVPGPTGHLRPLTNRFSGYIGDISYSLYIWHFPVIVFVTVLHPQLGRTYLAFSVLLVAGLAVLSYHLIETPLRHLTWFPSRARSPRRDARRLRRAVMSGVMAVTFVVIAGTFVTRSPMRAAATPLQELSLPADVTQAQRDRSFAIEAAMGAASWPTLAPSVVAVQNDRAPEWLRDGCLGDDWSRTVDPYRNAQHCVYGDTAAGRTLVLLGDSVAISYLPGIRKALGRSWRIEVYTLSQCPAIQIRVKLGDGSPFPHCDAFHPEVMAHLRRIRPAQVVLTSSPDSTYRLASGAVGEAAVQQWQQAAGSTFRALSKVAGQVVVLDPPPTIALLVNCYTPVSRPGDCNAGIEPGYLQMVRAQRAAAAAVPSVVYPSTLTWYCGRDGLCPAFVGAVPQTVDGRHLAATTSRRLAPLLSEALRGRLP